MKQQMNYLVNERALLRSEINALKEQRNQLSRYGPEFIFRSIVSSPHFPSISDIHAIMYIRSRNGYEISSQVCIIHPIIYFGAMNVTIAWLQTRLDLIPPPPPPDVPPRTAAWRVVDRKALAIQRSRLIMGPRIPPTPASAPEPHSSCLLRTVPERIWKALPPPPPRRHPSWATWAPDSRCAPSPAPMEFKLVVPPSGTPGLFGPLTPRSSVHGSLTTSRSDRFCYTP